MTEWVSSKSIIHTPSISKITLSETYIIQTTQQVLKDYLVEKHGIR